MNDTDEPDVIRLLKASGLDLTPEQSEAAIAFQRRADEAHETTLRVARAFPVRRDVAALKARWQHKDPNIRATRDDKGGVSYERQFTDAQTHELEEAYLASRPRAPSGFSWAHEANVFVGIIEAWAASIALFQATTPPEQKNRVRSLRSVTNALTKLDQAPADLDSGALSFLYAKLADSLAAAGFQLSESEGRPGSMMDDPMRAAAEAGEGRKLLRVIIDQGVQAATSATKDLPTIDRVETDPRLGTVRRLERLMLEHQLPFEATEASYAAQCARAMFELADYKVEKVAYCLRKAIDHPDSHARWLQSLRERAGCGDHDPSHA